MKKKLIASLMIIITAGLIFGLVTSVKNPPEAMTDAPAKQTPPSLSAPTDNITVPTYQPTADPLEGIPEQLIALLEKNPETRDFVLNYPEKKNSSPVIDLSSLVGSESMPLLMQWDERWGYNMYSGELFGLSGCGPTCLSMVCIYLLDNAEYTPKYIAEFSESNGYYLYGSGSLWTLISVGGPQLGLDVTEIPLDENRIIRNLEAGNPIICALGPGDFTSTGHFIVLTGYADGMVSVNDPNSRVRSGQLWDLDQIMSQIRNLWVCQA